MVGDSVEVSGQRVHVDDPPDDPRLPLKSNLEAQVRMHVGAVPACEGVSVGFTHMSEAQRSALRAQLQPQAGSEGERKRSRSTSGRG